MKWAERLLHRHPHERAEDHVAELRATAAALAAGEDDQHEQGLQEAHEAQHEAERSVARAVEARMALHILLEGLKAGPKSEDRFAAGMEETFKNRRREDPE